MNKSIVSQIPKNLLFRYRIPCRPVEASTPKPVKLENSFLLPNFSSRNNDQCYGSLRIGWHTKGLAIDAQVQGKKQALWCRETQLLESDGIQIWIDTRDTHNLHRATKFCHWFALHPVGRGPGKSSPMATMLKINRAREDSPCINRQKVQIESKVTGNGYRVTAFIPAASLHGWDPNEHRQVGFSYAFVDRELGWQTLTCGPELPIAEDPSLWCTLQLESPPTL